MGNSGSFSSFNQPLKARVVRLKCPFQDGVNINPHCDGVKCEYGLWCSVHEQCLLRCRGCGNGGLNRVDG